MACRFPLQVKLIDILGVFGLDQLCDELKLLAEPQNGLLEDSHFPGCPLLEHTGGSDWIDEDIEISLLVEMIDGIEVELDGFLLFLGVGLVDLVLGLDHLQNGVFLETKILDQLHVGMIVAMQTGLLYALVEPLEVRLCRLVSF